LLRGSMQGISELVGRALAQRRPQREELVQAAVRDDRRYAVVIRSLRGHFELGEGGAPGISRGAGRSQRSAPGYARANVLHDL
jgi:hypothetical protein